MGHTDCISILGQTSRLSTPHQIKEKKKSSCEHITEMTGF